MLSIIARGNDNVSELIITLFHHEIELQLQVCAYQKRALFSRKSREMFVSLVLNKQIYDEGTSEINLHSYRLWSLDHLKLAFNEAYNT